MHGPDLHAAILASDLPQKDQLAALVSTGILALGNELTDNPPVGTSRLGGRPDVPADFVWPTWDTPDGDTVPLSFIAQINLAELPDCPDRALLPEVGVLAFYYVCHFDIWDQIVSGFEKDEAGAFRVVYFESADALSRYEGKPDSLKAIEADFEQEFTDFFFPTLPLRFELCQTFPDAEHPALHGPGYSFMDDGRTNYAKLEAVLEQAGHSYRIEPEGFSQNLLLGHPQPIQTSVCNDMQHATAGDVDNERACGWQLLLQVDSQNEIDDMCWGDTGRLYFMIQREDLLARRWDKTHMIMQCS